MHIEVTESSGIVRMTIQGEVDEPGAEELKASFRRLNLSGVREVNVDIGHVSHIGSAGIGKFLVFYKDLAVRGAELKVIDTPAHIFQLLREMKLDTIFTITPKA